MKVSTTLQSKISKTKKRLSDETSLPTILALGTVALMGVLTFGMRSVIAPRPHGIVEAEIPVVSEAVKDPNFHGFRERPNTTIGAATPIVILTPTAFLFGDMAAFSTQLSDIRNKFSVMHRDGAPDLPRLLKTMEMWRSTRKTGEKDVLVFLPTGDIPAPIMIQVLAGLRKSPMFERVVLASGVL